MLSGLYFLILLGQSMDSSVSGFASDRFWLSCTFELTLVCLSLVVVDVENGTKAIFDMPEFDPKVWRDTIIVCSKL